MIPQVELLVTLNTSHRTQSTNHSNNNKNKYYNIIMNTTENIYLNWYLSPNNDVSIFVTPPQLTNHWHMTPHIHIQNTNHPKLTVLNILTKIQKPKTLFYVHVCMSFDYNFIQKHVFKIKAYNNKNMTTKKKILFHQH